MIREEKGGGNIVEPMDEGEAEKKKGEQGRWWHMGRCIKVVEG